MNPVILIITILLSLGISTAFADKRTANSEYFYNNPGSQCPMAETSQININFNSEETDLDKIKDIMDKKIKGLEALAKEAGVEIFDMQSMNYNVNVNNYNRGNCSPACEGNSIYRLSGNINFTAFPSDKATDLMVMINERGYSGSLNVNMYRQCR